eukprot:751197-Hanusia_phi.AAC.3
MKTLAEAVRCSAPSGRCLRHGILTGSNNVLEYRLTSPLGQAGLTSRLEFCPPTFRTQCCSLPPGADHHARHEERLSPLRSDDMCMPLSGLLHVKAPSLFGSRAGRES